MDLSRIEQEVVHAYRVGSPLALTGDLTHRTIRGEVVARLVTGEIVPAGPRSRLDLAGSVIDGPVDLTGAVIDRPVSMRNCSFTHPVVLTEAEVRTLRFPGCRLPTLEGTNLRVQGDLELDAGFSTTGRVVLIGARIAGLLRMSQAHVGTDQSLVEDDLPVLCASRMRVEGAVMAAGLRVHGQLKLVSVRVGGHLSLKDASITHTGHTALHAERMEVGESVLVQRASFDGRVFLHNAKIGGGLDAADASFGPDAPSGASVSLRYVRVGRHASFRRATVSGRLDATRATIDGMLILGDLTFSDSSALVLRRLSAAGVDLRVTTAPELVDLRHARIDVIEDRAASWSRRLDLDGLTYRILEADPPCSVVERLGWVGRSGDRYQPQPYDQLVTSLTTNGHEQDARRVGLEHQRVRRRTLGRPGRFVGHVLDATVAYGYRTWQVVPWIAVLTIAGAVVFATRRPTPRADAPAFNSLAFSFDLLLPVIDLGQASTHTPHGGARWVAWAVVIAGWVLTSALVAGLTRSFSRA